MNESKLVKEKRARSKTGNFFIIDKRLWTAVCEAGDVNASAAWLLLSQGTGGNNRTTAWSVDSIMRYLGMGHPRAKTAIDRLLRLKFIRHSEKHKPERPRYDLLNFAEWEAASDQICFVDSSGTAEDNLIWLPNTLVTGTSEGEKSPINRLRAAGDLWPLRLFVDLYHAHNLRDDGGISRNFVWEEYEAEEIGKQGLYRIMGFRPNMRNLYFVGPFLKHESRGKSPESGHAVWESVKILEQTGLLTFVPHLVENNTKDAEVVHPFGVGGHSEHPIETQIGTEASKAAAAMCAPWQLQKARDSRLLLCPISRDYPKARMVGIARLHYRPFTRRTSAWSSNLHSKGAAYIDQFLRLTEECAARANSFV